MEAAEREALIAHIEGRLHRGGNADAVVDELMAQGFSLHDARELVKSVSSDVRSGYQKFGWSMVAQGIGLITLGAVITFGTYGLAAHNGGGYGVFTIGLLVAGGSLLVGGLVKAVRGGP